MEVAKPQDFSRTYEFKSALSKTTTKPHTTVWVRQMSAELHKVSTYTKALSVKTEVIRNIQLKYTPTLCTCFPYDIFNYKDIVDILS